jgi:hypothetical protein
VPEPQAGEEGLGVGWAGDGSGQEFFGSERTEGLGGGWAAVAVGDEARVGGGWVDFEDVMSGGGEGVGGGGGGGHFWRPPVWLNPARGCVR